MTVFVFLGGIVVGFVILLAAYSFFSSMSWADNPMTDEFTGLLIQALIFLLLSGIASLMVYEISKK